MKTKAFLCKILGIKKMNCRKIDFIKVRVIVGKIQTQVKETEKSRRQCSFCVTSTNGRGGKNTNKTKTKITKKRKQIHGLTSKFHMPFPFLNTKNEKENLFPLHIHLAQWFYPPRDC